ncbi:EamA family transporter [Paenibacillus sp. SC116]|uniref:EamA family transporter n=1 Tax=Paenibacillus sp. SC116 TaxID=2968986 RepID=UPI00215A8C05|nr:EamA family transporter [Paenibacillus sp. SC116]MCR8845573.1 EamA family transporter [Paenibacillus sp. SC116]
MINYIILFANIILLVTGQILFKLGIEKAGGLVWNKIITSWYVIGGLSLYGIATILWFVVLSRLPLSVAYPLQSISYILGIAAAFFIFSEPVSATKWVGAGVILIGVYLIAK